MLNYIYKGWFRQDNEKAFPVKERVKEWVYIYMTNTIRLSEKQKYSSIVVKTARVVRLACGAGGLLYSCCAAFEKIPDAGLLAVSPLSGDS